MNCILAQTTQPVTALALAPWWHFGLWGIAGGFVVEGIVYWRATKDAKARNETPPAISVGSVLGSIMGITIRLTVGGLLAMAFGMSGQISVPLGALVVGMTAPRIIDQYVRGEATAGMPPRANN